ncbi:MAG: DNA-binding protein [Pseudopedobacter saltans]|uniref:DNA-binding protein n=1 Tax=Pseudopedobacter saltans TaxID=151895 RepID=A0A2W5GW57_9SPHI|nr:MAG: DNA-binding protein [Pseudopedobacter saltans]
MDRNQNANIAESQLLLAETIRRLLFEFRQQLLSDIRLVLSDRKPSQEKQWLKSAEVRKLLGISHGTLQTLRNNGTLPFARIGGVIYYSRKELDKILDTKQFV